MFTYCRKEKLFTAMTYTRGMTRNIYMRNHMENVYCSMFYHLLYSMQEKGANIN